LHSAGFVGRKNFDRARNNPQTREARTPTLNYAKRAQCFAHFAYLLADLAALVLAILTASLALDIGPLFLIVAAASARLRKETFV
jgi:hypothetical protein